VHVAIPQPAAAAPAAAQNRFAILPPEVSMILNRLYDAFGWKRKEACYLFRKRLEASRKKRYTFFRNAKSSIRKA
jgi:hypothetical protein